MSVLLGHSPDTARRRTMVSLFTGVALLNIGFAGASTAATLIAAGLGGEAVSGLPSAAGVLGAALGALGIGALTARYGRRFALLVAYGVACAGALTGFIATVGALLPLLVLGVLLLGVGNGGALLSRYAAAELYPAERRGFALSAIVWSGTVGAVVGPALIAPAAAVASGHGLPRLSGPILVGALAIAGAALATAGAPASRPAPRPVDHPGEPATATLRRPAVRLAVVAMAAAQITMVAVMLMTPLQLERHGHGLDVVGWIVSAHMIGMFALAPLSGKIADRFGGRATIGAGSAVLLTAAALAALLPTAHSSGLPVALFLLGYGWNLVFVGGSTVLSRDLPEHARVRLQGAVDAIIWVAAMFASLAAGPLFGSGGYPVLAALAGLVALVPAVLLRR
ncbi:MFS transporter [Actinophytocola sp.]|uniref:MFS transporter n=1 Tax=Actinophytocola sp. TaxID=1872138 RepID=UPI002D7EDE56|nr:MFS transporter [Actinophytocola sp.]HET9143930.1 MFS transporter [Actinophytocola sp.]